MKLKVNKFWAENGDVILQVRDHDAIVPHQVFWRQQPVRLNLGTRVCKVVLELRYPRGTPKEEVRRAAKSALFLAELSARENAV